MSPNWLLLRGLTRGNGHWGYFPSILKKKYPEIEIEFLEISGNGTQNKEKTHTDPIALIKDLQSRSQFCQNKQSFNIFGISLGGMVALKWAELFPEQIESAYVINTSLKECSPFYHRLSPQNYTKLMKLLFEPDAYIRERGILGMTSNNLSQLRENFPVLAEFSRLYPCLKLNFFRQLVLAGRIQIDNIPHLPLKVIYSEKDRLINPNCSLEIGKKFGVTPIAHPSAGHDLPLDDPEWLCDVLMGKN